MEYPDREIEGVIKSLTTGGPSELQSTLDEYFVEDASFIHPYCYVPPFTRGFLPLARNLSSSWLVLGIYRWYKILSPTIDISIDSTAFDEKSGLLYVSIRQVFAIWFVPFYRAPVKLVTVLKLRSRSSAVGKKYIIESQEDLYQMNDCIQFLCPGLGPAIWTVWQVVSTVICVLLSLLFLPVYYLLNKDKRN